jgi:hypothetical protein
MDAASLDELIGLAKVTIAHQHGVPEHQAHRITGSSPRELHDDAAALAREIGVHDPTTVKRDEGGRFAPRSSSAGSGFDINRAIRQAAGRSA